MKWGVWMMQDNALDAALMTLCPSSTVCQLMRRSRCLGGENWRSAVAWSSQRPPTVLAETVGISGVNEGSSTTAPYAGVLEGASALL